MILKLIVLPQSLTLLAKDPLMHCLKKCSDFMVSDKGVFGGKASR
jgi:hypothetical protein